MRAVQLFTFLDYCSNSHLKKEVLECGAGVWSAAVEPLFVRFYRAGYTVHGIEIDVERRDAAAAYCDAHQIVASLREGDLRALPFADASMSFIYSYNTIFHMPKDDVARAMKEIERVLKPGGLCFVNFLSVESDSYGRGEEVGKGAFLEREGEAEALHVYYEDVEADPYFERFDLLHKEKRVREWPEGEGRRVRAYIDYIARKR